LPNEPEWLSADDVAELNQVAVEQTGEPFFIRELGLLYSACHRPINAWNYDGEGDVVRLAALLMMGIIRNHPFGQGNKRTGFAAARMFLNINGWDLSDLIDDRLGALITEFVADHTPEREVSVLLDMIAHPEGRPEAAMLWRVLQPSDDAPPAVLMRQLGYFREEG
jgi:death-on-curing protein